MILESEDELDVPTKVPTLKDLSKHKFNIKLRVPAHTIEAMEDAEFSKLVGDIEDSKADDFCAWHYWDKNVYVFDVAGTKGYQEVADVTKDLRKALKLQGHQIRFFPSEKIKHINDLYSGTRYYDNQEVKV